MLPLFSRHTHATNGVDASSDCCALVLRGRVLLEVRASDRSGGGGACSWAELAAGTPVTAGCPCVERALLHVMLCLLCLSHHNYIQHTPSSSSYLLSRPQNAVEAAVSSGLHGLMNMAAGRTEAGHGRGHTCRLTCPLCGRGIAARWSVKSVSSQVSGVWVGGWVGGCGWGGGA